MILLKANSELQQTFEKLIQTMKISVAWNGIFVVLDNYMILQGEVRSLFFHFDTRKVATNIIDIPEQEQIPRIVDKVQVQNAVNMILYAFGKWGTIGGLKVDKTYPQLNQLFCGILREFHVEPEYTPEYLRFYRNGMRITYEDVIQMAIEYRDEEEQPEEGEAKGLWRKIVWKKEQADFTRVETSLAERQSGRLGNNFYMVGYLCPECGEKLHMVVYPVGKEFRIETEEGGVLLARACTCDRCNSFYTPRPKKLLSEGDVYAMRFEDDGEAYEDYLELLGRNGEQVSNYHCNEYADGRRVSGEEDQEDGMEEFSDTLPELTDAELKKITARMEEGYYPAERIQSYERQVGEQRERRQRKDAGKSASGEADRMGSHGETESSGGNREAASGTGHHRGDNQQAVSGGENHRGALSAGTSHARDRAASGEESRTGGRAASGEEAQTGDRTVPEEAAQAHARRKAASGESVQRDGGYGTDIILTPEEREEAERKYEARLQAADRYSERQLKELKSQLEREKKLTPGVRGQYIEEVEQRLIRKRADQLAGKVNACEGKNYLAMKRVLEELENAGLPEEIRRPLWEKLSLWKRAQAEREVEQLVAKMPANLDRNQYQKYVQRIRDYEEADLAPYEEKLRERREAAERQEIANVVKRARKLSREDLTELAAKLRDGDFLPELVLPYMEKVEDKIRQMDAEAIELICPDPMRMSFEEGMEAYRQLEAGDFLPELKTDALKLLSKRLEKIKTDECELLVKKLETELAEAGIGENPRHHFYPARKVLLHQAAPEETELIDFAMASYAAGRGLFEYPILVVDATRNGSGKEGIILTPDQLYYSTLLNAYGIPVSSIEEIHASTGLLNKGLYVYQTNGTKTRLPYAVEGRELPVFAEVLNSFVQYLKEKPDSRNLMYLAKEKHETICCFRCGYAYKEGSVCPKCGYQNNG